MCSSVLLCHMLFNNLRYVDDTTLMAENEEELRSFLMKVKVESENVGLAQHSENKDHGIWSNHLMANRSENSGNSVRLFWGAPKSLQTLSPWKKSYDKPSQHVKKQRHDFADKGLSSQSYGFSSGHVWT